MLNRFNQQLIVSTQDKQKISHTNWWSGYFKNKIFVFFYFTDGNIFIVNAWWDYKTISSLGYERIIKIDLFYSIP